MNTHSTVIARLAMLRRCQSRFRPHGFTRTMSSTAPAAFAARSTVTSTNDFALSLMSLGSGRNRISRVVLSTV